MMKTLHLLRHGKSSWKDPLLGDIDRPLKKRGHRDAVLVAGAMADAGWIAESVFCSGAVRARQTIDDVVHTLGKTGASIQFTDALYTFDFRMLLEWLSGREENELTLVGHNPALHDMVEWYSAQSVANFPTCAYCQLELELDNWRQFSQGAGRVVTLIRPKELRVY